MVFDCLSEDVEVSATDVIVLNVERVKLWIVLEQLLEIVARFIGQLVPREVKLYEVTVVKALAQLLKRCISNAVMGKT